MALELPKARVELPYSLHAKIMHWVKMGGSHECSGLGKVVVENGTIKVQDAWMVKQKNSGAETEMDGDHIATLLYEKRLTPGAMCFWWHSHANMGVFWSSTDRDQINKLAANGLCVAIVFNARGEMKTCVATGGPSPAMHQDDVQVSIMDASFDELKPTWEAEYESNVSRNVQTFSGGSAGYLGVGGRWNDSDDFYSDFYERQYGSGVAVTYDPKQQASVSEINRHAVKENRALSAVDDARRRLRELDADEETLQQAMFDRKVTKQVCDIIEITWENGLEMDSNIIGQGSVTIEDLIWNKSIEIDEELQVLVDGLRRKEK